MPVAPRLITHNGETLSIAAWAQRLGITYQALWSRLTYGWSIAQAVGRSRKMPLKPATYTYKGKRLTLAQLSALSGISPEALRGRLEQGWTVAQAVSLPLRHGAGKRRGGQRRGRRTTL